MANDTSWVESMPAVYDALLGPALFEPYARHVAALVAEHRPRTVLEIAAGSGILTRELVRALPDSEITATDLNPAMVRWGREQVPEAAWAQADAQQLDLADDGYDLAVCQFGAMFFPDRPAAYAEAARVLAPGGVLVLAVWDAVTGSPLSAAVVECLHAELPDDPPRFLERTPHGYADEAQIRADLEAGGLVVEAFDRVALTGLAGSAAGLTEGFCLGSPLRFELQERGDLAELTERLKARMAERFGADPLDCPLSALVVTARAGWLGSVSPGA